MTAERDLTRISHHTKIIATLGPATSDAVMLEQLIRIGLNVVRFNFSHGSAEFHGNNAKLVREASKRANREVAIMADLQGPKIRVGKITDGKMPLKKGDTLILDAEFKGEGKDLRVGLDYPELPRDVKTDDILLLDDGLITLKVKKVLGSEVHTEVMNDSVLKSNKGINKQGGGLSAPALTPKDLEDLETALKIGADYIAVSFVKSAADIDYARQLILRSPNVGSTPPGIVAKIERVEAIDNLEGILQASDGVMVARGDLAVEVGNPAVPALQKHIIRAARKFNCFTITATQMMESMINNPVPTRAEVSDVANAVLDGTDAVMLSAESAVGQYPFETIKTMAEICRAAEKAQKPISTSKMDEIPIERIDQSIAYAAVVTAKQLQARALIAFTHSGSTAFHISRYAINLPIHALTHSVEVERKMAIYRGVRPALLDTSKKRDEALEEAENYLVQRRHLKTGDLYVIASGRLIEHMGGGTDSLQIGRVK